ncbi:MAG: hypothetical protein AB8C95_14420 [Phycisphaeraceae bacterium]
MNRRSLSVLIVLNVVLLAAIALTLGPVPQAQAQLGGGSYLMIAGNTSQAQQQVVYVMDTRTGRVAGFTVNSANKKVEIIGTREIAGDLKAGASGGGR